MFVEHLLTHYSAALIHVIVKNLLSTKKIKGRIASLCEME